MKIILAQHESDDSRWDEFVRSREDSVVYHDSRWREFLRRVYGIESRYWMAEEEGRITGVLPVALVPGLRGGLQAVSLPYHMYGGLLAEDTRSGRALIEAASGDLRDRGADPWELRQPGPLETDLAPREDKITVMLPLPKQPGELWDALKAKVRNQVRKGEKAGLEIRVNEEGSVERFYSIMVLNMRDLGSPVHSLRFFQQARELFPEAARVHTVHLGQDCVAAGFTLAWNSRVELPWASSIREQDRQNCANMFLYWNILRDSIERGAGMFDFGRCTRGGGTHRFKLQWGGEEVPLYYYYWRRSGNHSVPPGTHGAAFQIATRVWRRLPLSLTRVLGPRLVRTIP